MPLAFINCGNLSTARSFFVVAAAALRNVKAREQSKRAAIRCLVMLAGVIDLAPTILGMRLTMCHT